MCSLPVSASFAKLQIRKAMTEKPQKSFFAQLKERKVIRVGIVYIVVGWLVIQVGEVTFEGLTLLMSTAMRPCAPA